MDEPGIFILRDLWLSLEKNQPPEMKVIRQRYLEEIERDVQEKWANRERTFIDLKILKDWYQKDWQTRTKDSLSVELLEKFKKKKFLNSDDDIFAQLLSQKLFKDKINEMEVAKEFTRMTKDGKRKDMGLELYKIWARSFLKKVIKERIMRLIIHKRVIIMGDYPYKPEYFIMVSSNLSDFATTIEHRTQFGKVVDKILTIVERNGNKPSMAKQIDRVFKEHLSSLFRLVESRIGTINSR